MAAHLRVEHEALLIGHYAAGNFHLTSEGGGTGTVVTDPAAGTATSGMIGSPHH
jgi:hypothetical protein